MFDGNCIGGSFLLFGRSNPNELTAAVFTCFRSEKSDDVEAKILALDGATYNTVADNKSVTITGSRITPYSKFALLSADTFHKYLFKQNSKAPSKNVNSLENYMKNAPAGVSFCDCQMADDNPKKGSMSICMTFVSEGSAWGLQYLFSYEQIHFRTMANGITDETVRKSL